MILSDLLYFVEHETGCTACVDALHGAFYGREALDLAPEQHLHRGVFCEFAKRHGRDGITCPDNKQRSRAIAAHGKPFCGTCPRGVWELAWPVKVDENHAATVYLGHLSHGLATDEIGGDRYAGPSLPDLAGTDLSLLRKRAASGTATTSVRPSGNNRACRRGNTGNGISAEAHSYYYESVGVAQ